MEAMDPSENPNHAKLLKRLGLTNQQLAQAAQFTNTNYPNLDLEFSLQDPDNITANSPAYLNIRIERDIDDDDNDDKDSNINTTVHAPLYPTTKLENWWLVIGDPKASSGTGTGALLAIKRITIARKLELKLEFAVQSAGTHELRLFLMSDSYVGVDQDPKFTVVAGEGESEGESGDDEGEGGSGEDGGDGERRDGKGGQGGKGDEEDGEGEESEGDVEMED